MKARCCRSLPRCATCPVLLAAQGRFTRATPTADAFAAVRTVAPREMPACVLEALEALDERRFQRRGRD
jgi:hypothetical protein